jgi:hypothetical protein
MESASELIVRQRQVLIRDVIRRCTPRWWKWPFDWFDVCPLTVAAIFLQIDWKNRNSAFLLLEHYHCVGYWGIPREIRRAIPALIREALSSKVMVTCEIEETPAGAPDLKSRRKLCTLPRG